MEDIFRSQLSNLCYNHLGYNRTDYERGEYISSSQNGIQYISLGRFLNSNDQLPNLSVFQIVSFNGNEAEHEWFIGMDSYSYHVSVEYDSIVENVIDTNDILNLIRRKDSHKLVKLIR